MAGFWASSWYAKQWRRQCRCRHPAWYWAQLTSHRLPLPECLWVCFKAHQIQDILKKHLSRTLQFQDFRIYSDQPCASMCQFLLLYHSLEMKWEACHETLCYKMPASTSWRWAACWFGWMSTWTLTNKGTLQRITTREWKNSWRLAEALKATKKQLHSAPQASTFWMGQVWVEYSLLKKHEKTSTWTSCHLAENHAPNLHVFHKPCPHVSGWWWAPHRKVHRRVSRWSSCRCPNGIADFPVEPPWGTAQIHSAMACYGYGKFHEIETAGIS